MVRSARVHAKITYYLVVTGSGNFQVFRMPTQTGIDRSVLITDRTLTKGTKGPGKECGKKRRSGNTEKIIDIGPH